MIALDITNEPAMRIAFSSANEYPPGVVDVAEPACSSFQSMGWSDLPIMVHKEDHPSSSKRRLRMQQNTELSILRDSNMLANTRTNGPSSFGWEDFPIVIEHHGFARPSEGENVTSSHYYINGPAVNIPLKPLQKHVPEPKYPVSLSSLFINHSIYTANAPIPIPIASHKVEPLSKFGWGDFPITNDTDDVVVCHPKPPTRRRVRFSNVKIRTHAICLGDHPLSESFPITFDWSHQGPDSVQSVEAFEATSRRPTVVRLDEDQRRSRIADWMGLTLSQVDELEKKRVEEFAPASMSIPRVLTSKAIQLPPTLTKDQLVRVVSH